MTGAGGALGVLGAVLVAVALAGQVEAPQVSQVAAEPRATAQTPAATATASTVQPPVAAVPTPQGAPPVQLSVPSIGVRAEVVPLGLQDDGSLEVPDAGDVAGWYALGPTPGQRGPAVVVGHVDSEREGPAVFFRLAELQPGAEVVVERGDGTRAVFVVEAVEQHPKDAFPTEQVYGDTDSATLRLVTCGGAFDAATGHYRDNVVVYARLSHLA